MPRELSWMEKQDLKEMVQKAKQELPRPSSRSSSEDVLDDDELEMDPGYP